ncbi:hypothetical protein [Erwinia phage Gungnir39]|nr:hypothetical protein [Erwinia phage Gungnir39]
MAVPLPLAIGDIEAYSVARGVEIEKDEFEAAIFALDDKFRAKWAEDNKPRKSHAGKL